MNPKLAEVTPIKIREIKAEKSTVLPEILSYLGALLVMSGVGLIMYQKWDQITQSQRTATFSLLAIAFFVAGLLAGDTEDIRRRVSGFLYVLSAGSAGGAVYVTFPKDLAPFRALALAAIVALFGYTISQTAFGHIALYSMTAGTLVALIYENVESADLRLYTIVSVSVALSLFWIMLAETETIERELGLSLGLWTFFLASQWAFAQEYRSLSYSIAMGMIALCLWLYARIPSWVLVTAGMITFVTSLTEFIFETLDGSVGAAIGLLAIGALTVIAGVRTVGTRRNS
jgi:hypothetical protein